MSPEFKTKIGAFLERGECVQIVAPPGFGKSRFGRSLGGLFLDPNLLQTPEELLATLKASSETKLIVFDSFDQLLFEPYQTIHKYLKAYRDNHRGQLALVFLVVKPLPPHLQPLLGDLYELATEHIVYLPALHPSEYDLFGFAPTPNQLTEITKLSGGIPALVKICCLAMRDSTSLDPSHNPKLQAQIEEMLSASPNLQAYQNSQLVQDYLSNRNKRDLSATETRLLNLFTEHLGHIVSKDQIAQTV